MLAFQISYDNHVNYPSNLISKDGDPGHLEALKLRLDAESERLCSPEGSVASVHFREFIDQASVPYHDFEVKNEQELRKHLKDVSLSNSAAPPVNITLDPACRIIFLTAKSSRAKLKITRQMLTRILSYHQVFPGYLDFLFVFGRQDEPLDMAFSGFREQTTFRNTLSSNGSDLEALGRSRQRSQLCYNLKSVAPKSGSVTGVSSMEWSIRHVAVYHEFDFENGRTLWILTRGGPDIRSRVEDLTSSKGNPDHSTFTTTESSFRSSLAPHLLFGHWAAENWRWYIRWKEQIFAETTGKAPYSRRSPHPSREEYTPEHLQDIQRQEDDTNAAAMALECNVAVLTSLRCHYQSFLTNNDFPIQRVDNDIKKMASQIDTLIYDLKMQILRIKLLSQMIGDRKGLIHQLLQTQSTEKTESLSLKMNTLAVEAQKETIAMRIITVVTLFFLPATFVSKTFFSTDIVKYQTDDGTGSFSMLALKRWLEVALPLTFVTLVVGWYCYRESRKREILSEKVPMQKLHYYDAEIELGQA